MALSEILRAMEQDAGAQRDEVRKAAEVEAQSVIAQAETEAKTVKDGHLASARERLQREGERLFSAARLGAQREIRAARANWMGEAFNEAREHLARIRGEPRYAACLEKLTREAVAELGTEIKLEVDPVDAALMARIVAMLGVKAAIDGSLATLGGVRASTPDGRLIVTNTFETRLERARDELGRKLAALLESEDVSWEETTATATPASGA